MQVVVSSAKLEYARREIMLEQVNERIKAGNGIEVYEGK